MPKATKIVTATVKIKRKSVDKIKLVYVCKLVIVVSEVLYKYDNDENPQKQSRETNEPIGV